jgi:hypothetical protein
MDVLLKELRELEERVIVIRFKAMEKLRAPRKKQKSILSVNEPQLAPELPLDIPKPKIESVAEPLILIPQIEELPTPEPDPIESIAMDASMEEEPLMGEEIPENQISLIDSIEEISKEASINERMQRKTKKTLAQSLEGKPVSSVLKALNLNMKMGMIQALFAGEESRFRTTIKQIDEAQNLAEAQEVYNIEVPEELRAKEEMAQKLASLIKRRFA